MRVALAVLVALLAGLVGASGWSTADDSPDVAIVPRPPADRSDTPRFSADSLLAPFRGFEAPAGVSLAEAEAWAEATLAEMTLEERVAQLFIVELGAVRDPDGLARMGVGGFHIHRRTAPEEVLSTTTRLNGRADVPLFFTADYEWGVGTVSSNFTELPPAMAYGAADDEALAEAGGAVTALEARATGINVLFAPVADVNNNPANPIINTRSFGENPERVGVLAAAYVRGAQANGVLATLKHFPGHGNTDTDTHLAFAAVPGSWRQLWETELAPYRVALDADPGFVMSTHLWARALDTEPTPATVSRAALTDVLRDTLGYDGIVTTDAMNMAAVRDRYGPRDRAVLPLLAGADVILNETSPRRAIGFVVDAVQSGRLSEERINASARRVLRGKARIGLHTASAPERSRLRRMLTEVRGAPLADALTQSAVTVVRGGLIPVTGQRVALVQLANFDAGRAMTRMERDLRADRQVRITRRGGNRGDAVAAARDADVVVLAMHLDVMKRAAPEPTRQQRDVIAAISSTGTPVVAVTIGNPYAASHVADAEGLVMAYDGTVRTATAVADVLRGRREATGRLPVSVPGL